MMHNIDRVVPIPMNSLAESQQQQQQVATLLSGGGWNSRHLYAFHLTSLEKGSPCRQIFT
jgi:hypothetical protein